MMETIELTYPHSLTEANLPETVCAIGFFDGVHRGHQQVIQTAITEAKNKRMESAVITFHPHPSVVLQNGHGEVKYITPLREKQEILQKLHIDRLYIITFDKQLSSLLPEKFINHFIIGLNIKHVVAGFDFSYGYKGQGNMQTIEKYSKCFFTHTTIDKVESQGEKISSTKIRQCLHNHQIEDANALLGRPFKTSGTVVVGDKRGHTIGYPTANIDM